MVLVQIYGNYLTSSVCIQEESYNMSRCVGISLDELVRTTNFVTTKLFELACIDLAYAVLYGHPGFSYVHWEMRLTNHAVLSSQVSVQRGGVTAHDC
jgi:hypothetical protein